MNKVRSGDTIIEVILAVTIFSMMAVGAISIMNSGVSVAQRSLEITLVRSEMKAQAEGLRYIHQQYMSGDSTATAEWNKIINERTQESPSAYGALNIKNQCLSSSELKQPFALDIDNINKQSQFMSTRIEPTGSAGSLLPYAHFDNGSSTAIGYGLWVESVRKSSSQNYVDFHIRACWDTIGESVPTTLGTIVRLYVPNK